MCCAVPNRHSLTLVYSLSLCLDGRPLTVCLQQCEFAESHRKNRANTSSFFNGESLNALSTFSFIFYCSFGCPACLLYFRAFERKANVKKKPTTLLKGFILWKTSGEERVEEFLTRLVQLRLFIRLYTTSAFHTCLYPGRKPIKFASKKKNIYIYIYIYNQSCVVSCYSSNVIFKYFFAMYSSEG